MGQQQLEYYTNSPYAQFNKQKLQQKVEGQALYRLKKTNNLDVRLFL